MDSVTARQIYCAVVGKEIHVPLNFLISSVQILTLVIKQGAWVIKTSPRRIEPFWGKTIDVSILLFCDLPSVFLQKR